MRRPRFVDISIFILKYIFNWRFWIAEITKKSESYKKIIDKMLFENDEIVIIPNAINVNKKIESEGKALNSYLQTLLKMLLNAAMTL